MNTGIKVEDSCVEEFNNLRMKRSHRYVIMKVSDDKSKIEIEHLGKREATFGEFKELMPKD